MLDQPSDDWTGLLSQLDADERDWTPAQAGEQVYGVIAGIDYMRAKNGNTFPMVRMAGPDGVTWKVIAGRAAIRGELDRRKVQPGDRIAIRYLGLVQGRDGGRDFHDYRIAHQPVGPRDPAQAFDANRVLEDDLGLIPDALASGTADPWQAHGPDQPGF